MAPSPVGLTASAHSQLIREAGKIPVREGRALPCPRQSTTKTTLAPIPYLNCEPFYAGLNALELDVVRDVPRELGRLADTGVPTCGPMAVVDWFRLKDRYEPL